MVALCLAVVLAQASLVPSDDPIAAVERQQQRLFERIAPSVVFISRGNALGSGFFVGTEGLILTSPHLVRDRAMVEVVLHDGRRAKGKVVERAEPEDLA